MLFTWGQLDLLYGIKTESHSFPLMEYLSNQLVSDSLVRGRLLESLACQSSQRSSPIALGISAMPNIL